MFWQPSRMAMQRIPIEKKSTPVCRRCAVPCVARLVRRLRNSRYALRQSSPKSPDRSVRLGGAQGKMKCSFVCAARTSLLDAAQRQPPLPTFYLPLPGFPLSDTAGNARSCRPCGCLPRFFSSAFRRAAAWIAGRPGSGAGRSVRCGRAA